MDSYRVTAQGHAAVPHHWDHLISSSILGDCLLDGWWTIGQLQCLAPKFLDSRSNSSVQWSLNRLCKFHPVVHCWLMMFMGLYLDLTLLLTKVLNSVRRGCLGFPMEWDMPPSCLVLTLRTGDIPRHPYWDIGTMAGQFRPDTWDATLFHCPVGRSVWTWILAINLKQGNPFNSIICLCRSGYLVLEFIFF